MGLIAWIAIGWATLFVAFTAFWLGRGPRTEREQWVEDQEEIKALQEYRQQREHRAKAQDDRDLSEQQVEFYRELEKMRRERLEGTR